MDFFAPLALLAGLAEFVGGISLLLGIGLRLMAVPMIVAATTAHWKTACAAGIRPDCALGVAP